MTLAYKELETRFAHLATFREAIGILTWDRETTMPRGGAPGRADQLAALEGLCHGMLSEPSVGDLLEQAEGESGALEEAQQANIRAMRRVWRHANAVPADLVEAQSRACSACQGVWLEARPAADFAAFLPTFSEVINLTRQSAAAKADAMETSPYDALLDEYDPGLTEARIDPLFERLADVLPGHLEHARANQREPEPLAGPFPIADQEALGRKLMAATGFDFERGRLDVSAHPFTGGATGDVRITTRYDENDFASGIMGVMHETGHALYEQGLPDAWVGQPAGRDAGMSIHESQSLLIEMQVGRGRPFLEFLAPLLRETYGGDGPGWQVDNLVRLSNRVEPGFIRVDADEITYPFHIILRYRLERDLLSGNLDPADLPPAWNDGLEALLGIRPPDDRLGCLQDIHWSDGLIGYFPTYTLGALAAAQLYRAALDAHPEIPDGLRRGDFGVLLSWLRGNVHQWGAILTTDELIEKATGAPLSTAAFENHLAERYGG